MAHPKNYFHMHLLLELDQNTNYLVLIITFQDFNGSVKYGDGLANYASAMIDNNYI